MGQGKGPGQATGGKLCRTVRSPQKGFWTRSHHHDGHSVVVKARFYDLLCRVEPVPAVTTFSPTERLEPSGTQFHGTNDNRRLRLFSGNSNPELAREIVAYLGIPDGPRVIKRFADGEFYIQIQESIRGCDVFLIQPTCAPVNDHLMELLIMVDACRRASARQITAVIPYYGYARADRKTAGRESITAKLVANLLVKSGVDRVLAMDLHSSQIQGYFDIPCDHIYGSPVLVDYLSTRQLQDLVVVSPDVGGVARARAFAKQMQDAPLAIIDKRRSEHNVAESLTVIGDVAGKTAVLIDDMIDTGGTISQGAKLLRRRGASRVLCCATHAVFSPPSIDRLSEPGLFEEVVVTNSIPVPPNRMFDQLRVLSVANMLGEAIWRIHEESSVSSMFR
jgi:ribose-phosphate pyrophosphokinase